MRALGVERAGDLSPYAAGGAGDEGGLAGKVEHFLFVPLIQPRLARFSLRCHPGFREAEDRDP